MASRRPKSRSKVKRRSPAVKSRQISVRGLKTAWLEAGRGKSTLLVFLHGFPDDATVWRSQLGFFGCDFHVIAPMMRGAGGSEAALDSRRYGLAAASLDQLEILKHCDPSGKKGVVVVGHDLGAVHGWYLAPLLSGRLKGLVVLNGAHLLQMWSRMTHVRQLLKSWYLFLFMLPIVPEVLMRVFGHTLIRFIYLYGGMPADLAEAHAKGFSHMPETVKQYREFIKTLPGQLLGRDHYRLKVPVLSLSAMGDPFLEPAHLDELEGLAERPIARVIEGRHWIQCEDPERVNRLLVQFIREECRV